MKKKFTLVLLTLLTITIFQGNVFGKDNKPNKPKVTSFDKQVVINADNSDFDNSNALFFKNETLDAAYTNQNFMLWNNNGSFQLKTFSEYTENDTPFSIEWSTGNFGIGSYLGVGTYEPTARLHVLGNSLLDGNLNLTGNTVLDGNLNVAGNTNLKGTSTVSFQNTDSHFFLIRLFQK